MNGKLEVGGLAMVVRSKLVPENVGKVVRLEKRIIGDGHLLKKPDGYYSNTKKGVPGWIVTGNLYGRNSRTLTFSTHTHGYFSEENLMPLSGYPDAQVVADKQALEI